VSLVELKTYYDRFEAEIVRGRLESEGFDVLLFDGGLSAVHGGALPVRLMVLREDRHAALAVLAREPEA
jgi:hypothetical protein